MSSPSDEPKPESLSSPKSGSKGFGSTLTAGPANSMPKKAAKSSDKGVETKTAQRKNPMPIVRRVGKSSGYKAEGDYDWVGGNGLELKEGEDPFLYGDQVEIDIDLKYQGFDAASCYNQVVDAFDATARLYLGLVYCVVGRITKKKKDHIKGLNDEELTLMVGEKQYDGSKLLELFEGGKNWRDYNFSQVGSMCALSALANVIKDTNFQSLVTEAKTKFSRPMEYHTFDFAAIWPLTREAFLEHMALRLVRAANLPGYIPPNMEVSLSQVNFARSQANLEPISITMDELQEKFNEIAESRAETRKSSGMLVGKLMDSGRGQGARNEDLNLSNDRNKQQRTRASAHDRMMREYFDAEMI